MNTTEKFSRQPYLAWKEENGRIIVADEHEGCLYEFNSVAASIWKHLDGGLSIDEIIHKMIAQFSESPEKIRKDSLRFIRNLYEMDLIS